MSTYAVLIPISATPEERSAALDDLNAIVGDLKDQGVEPVADIICEPDGDRWVISWDDEDVPAAA